MYAFKPLFLVVLFVCCFPFASFSTTLIDNFDDDYKLSMSFLGTEVGQTKTSNVDVGTAYVIGSYRDVSWGPLEGPAGPPQSVASLYTWEGALSHSLNDNYGSDLTLTYNGNGSGINLDMSNAYISNLCS